MDKALFHGIIAKMMNEDSHWHGSGNRLFTTDEMETFIKHLWQYINENWPMEHLALTHALLKTQHIDSAQDQATEILNRLKL